MTFRASFDRLVDLSPGAPVVAAVSGGLDSVVLLHLLRFALDGQFTLHVAHFDHAMRPGSEHDAAWVRGLALSWETHHHVARAHGLKSEADARNARYSFLGQVADQTGARVIALAHHADDQVETVLFRLLRGTGVDGLAGIPAKRGRIVRPLLPFRRAQLEGYARQHRLAHREDPSNFSRAYTRNRIRHDLLPQLDRDWPGSQAALLALAESAARARQGWNSMLVEIEKDVVTVEDTGFIELARQPLLEYHPEVRARLVRRLLARLGAAPGRTGTAAVTTFIKSGVSGSAIQVSRARVERAFDTIRLVALSESAPRHADQPLTIERPDSGTGITIIGGKQFDVQWAADGSGPGTAAGTEIDLNAATFPLTIRAWRPGDRIHLPYGSKKLKKLFIEKRLARAHRHSVPVVVDANDNVLCVVGLARAASAAPQGGPVFCITVIDGQSG